MSKPFTQEEVINEARSRHGSPVSIDMIDDAMEEETFEAAVQVILVDSYYWDMC